LILDEATSSIDVRAERVVQAALDNVSQSRTTIVIAHRLSTIRKADHIIVLQNGFKIEEGSHDDLISNTEGIYHNLVHAQQIDSVPSPQEKIAEVHNHTEGMLQQSSQTILSEDTDNQSKSRAYKQRGFFGTVGLFLYEQRAHWFLYLLTLLATVGCGSALALQSWFFAKVVEAFQFTGQKLTNAANFWALMFFILALVVAVCYFSLAYSSTSTSAHIAFTYRNEYFHSILRKPISFYDSDGNASGTLVSRLSGDPKLLQEVFALAGAFPMISIFQIMGCIAISFAFGWKLTLVTLFSAMPVLFLANFMRIRHEIQFEAMNTEVFASSSKFAAEAIGAFRTVTSLVMEDSIINRYSDLLKKQTRNAFRKAWHATLIFAFSDSVELCAMALSLWYGGQLLASHEYDPVKFFVVYVAIIQGGQAAGQFFSYGPNIAQAMAAANRILSLRVRAGEEDNVAARPLSPTSSKAGARIELAGVSFRYPTRNTPIFRHLDVVIESGQFVAFVGPSGCGKTTVISLLERFYDAVSGTIYFNGSDIRSIEMSSYRRAISLVPQEPKLFNSSVRDNLLLGLDSSCSTISEDEIIQACKDAEIHDFLTSLPEGYDTPLGTSAQTSLSGGQKQRLCIARALLRKPSLLLLDEATSSLDSQSEKLVQKAIERLAGQRNMTIIAVAHRLATIQKADVIFVFGESGVGHGSRIVERGNHHDLSLRRGAYWQMCQAQALDQ
jgi:ABC-type multidrug transport system fused ATPase/permease subunit